MWNTYMLMRLPRPSDDPFRIAPIQNTKLTADLVLWRRLFDFNITWYPRLLSYCVLWLQTQVPVRFGAIQLGDHC
jgi:hypothetical protein